MCYHLRSQKPLRRGECGLYVSRTWELCFFLYLGGLSQFLLPFLIQPNPLSFPSPPPMQQQYQSVWYILQREVSEISFPKLKLEWVYLDLFQQLAQVFQGRQIKAWKEDRILTVLLLLMPPSSRPHSTPNLPRSPPCS